MLPTSPPCGVYGADAASTGECARVTSRGPTREPAREGDSPLWTRAWRRPLRRCPFLPPSGQHPAAARVGAGHAGGRSGIRRADGHVPTMVGSVNGIPYGNKPDEDNYLVWRFQMEHVLRLADCWAPVAPVAEAARKAAGGPVGPVRSADAADGDGGSQGATPTARASPAVLTATEARADEVAKSIMALNVKPQHLGTFRTHPTARGVWEALAEEFLSHGRGDLYAMKLREQLVALEMHRNESAAKYVSRGRTLVWKLREMGIVLDEEYVAKTILSGALPKFKLVKDVLPHMPNFTVLRVLRGLRNAEHQFAFDRRHH